jgi:hypothetical protein
MHFNTPQKPKRPIPPEELDSAPRKLYQALRSALCDEAEARTVLCGLLCSVLCGLVFPEALQAARGGRRRYAH